MNSVNIRVAGKIPNNISFKLILSNLESILKVRKGWNFFKLSLKALLIKRNFFKDEVNLTQNSQNSNAKILSRIRYLGIYI